MITANVFGPDILILLLPGIVAIAFVVRRSRRHQPPPTPPNGWWQASDGRWYPPETHPRENPAGHADRPEERANSRRLERLVEAAATDATARNQHVDLQTQMNALAMVIGPELRQAAQGERVVEEGYVAIVDPARQGEDAHFLDAYMLVTNESIVFSQKLRADIWKVPWDLVVSAEVSSNGLVHIVAGRGERLEQEVFWFSPGSEPSPLRDALLDGLKQHVAVEDFD
jgi:hypothetical protein